MRRLLLAAALVGFAGSANAGLTSTLTIANDYLFDGVSQTQGDPAAQLSFDYAWDSGFYVGTWASNVDFNGDDPFDPKAEVDYYGGYTTSYDSGWGWTAGFAHYTYVAGDGDMDYTELTGGVTFPFGTTLQLWVADDDFVFGGETSRIKAKHSFDLGNDFSLLLEATHTSYDNSALSDYNHGQIGVSHPLGPFTAYIGYSDTDAEVLDGTDFVENENADGRVLFTLAYTFTLIE